MEPEIRLLSEKAILPVKRNGGYDLFAPEDLVLERGQTKTVAFDLSICLSPKTWGRIIPSPDVTWLELYGTVVQDHQPLVVVFHNPPNTRWFCAFRGYRIARLILENC